MPVIEIDSARVDYAARSGLPLPSGGGEARSLLFLHGGFGSSSQLWTSTMAALPPQYHAYAVNNFVRSDPPPLGYNVTEFARRAGGFIRALDLRRPVLAGHSMGGVVCLLTALMYPERVGGLVLVCTGASMRDHELGRQLLAEMKASTAPEQTIRSVSTHWFHCPPPPGFFDEYVALAIQAPWRALIDVQESLLATDLEDRLGEIEVPTLVVYGGHDRGRGPHNAETLLRGIHGSRAAPMPASGHSPMLETPDAFNAALHQFLETDVGSLEDTR